MAAVTIPLLNLRHNGPRGVGTAGLPVKALRQFKTPPPDLVAAEKKKLEAEKVKLVKSLRSGARPPLPPAAATRRLTPQRIASRQTRTWTGRLVSRASSQSSRRTTKRSSSWRPGRRRMQPWARYADTERVSQLALAESDWLRACVRCTTQTVQPKLEPSHAAQVASMQKLYELNRLEMLIKESKKLAAVNV
jgi:hypothetical protein